MTFWLVDSTQTDGEHPHLANYIMMPEYNEQDWSRAKSKQEIKHRLNAEDDTMPPEHLDHIAQTIWKFVHNIDKEDIICAVEKKSGKPHTVHFAEVVGNVEYNHQLGAHVLPVSWFKETASMLRLWGYKTHLADADQWPSPINNKKMALALRNHLPLPGNRFAKWALIILFVFLVVKLTRMYSRV